MSNDNNQKENEDNKEKTPMHHGAPPVLFQYARALRERETLAEKILWEELRMKKMEGLKFRRQHPLGIHILDFYCHAKKLAIELDGEYHDDVLQQKLDEERSVILEQKNITVIRFSNEEVIGDMAKVLERIREHLPPIAPDP